MGTICTTNFLNDATQHLSVIENPIFHENALMFMGIPDLFSLLGSSLGHFTHLSFKVFKTYPALLKSCSCGFEAKPQDLYTST